MATSKGKSPVISLPKAIEQVKKIYNSEGKNSFDDSVAVKLMGYSSLSGASRSALAAIKSYGLIDGRGSNLVVSDTAVTIIADENILDQTDRQKALEFALKSNIVFGELYDKFKDDKVSSLNISSYLQKNKGLRTAAADQVASRYKESLSIIDVTKLEDEEVETADAKREDVRIGDTIQWNSQGVDQFSTPRKVRATEEREGHTWLFVEGSETGIPEDEAEIIEKGDTTTDQAKGDLRRMAIPESQQNLGNLKTDTFTLDEGDVSIKWPKEMTEASFEDFTDWLILIHRKISREIEGKNIPRLSRRELK
ncbi:MAG: hypothetical protein F4008_14680 [Gammaproteobacteria bacterium]|nr:hypothetical protein [Gammaproteobacteria bacterium]MYL14982.1 hypothetical protein [Gammaproteobacteria bacterium]